jgi:hypothetical protein
MATMYDAWVDGGAIIRKMRMKIKELDFVFEPLSVHIDRDMQAGGRTQLEVVFHAEEEAPLSKILETQKQTILLKTDNGLRMKFIAYPVEISNRTDGESMLQVYLKYECENQEIVKNGIEF